MGSAKDVGVELDLSVRRLVARYAHLVDDADMDAVCDLFVDDGRLIIDGQHHEGRQAIRAFLETAPRGTLHNMSNVVVSYGSQEGTVHALSDAAFLAKVDGQWTVAAVCRYHDTMVGEGRSLRFRQRIVTLR